MRITGGMLRGRRVVVPRGKVRPTQDRVRQTLFSALGDRVQGARFLDLFAGSGAVGLEAWSRGAGYVCWVESAPAVARVMRRNIEALCDADAGSTCVVGADAFRFLASLRGPQEGGFDIVFADPPYDRGGTNRWIPRILAALVRIDGLAADGLVAVELGGSDPCEVREGWRVVRDRTYGGTRLLFLTNGRTEP